MNTISICCWTLIIRNINTCQNWLNMQNKPFLYYKSNTSFYCSPPDLKTALLLQALPFLPGSIFMASSIYFVQAKAFSNYCSILQLHPIFSILTLVIPFFSSEKDETRNNAKLELRCVCVRLPKAEACLGQMHSCCDQASENKWGKAQEHSINQPDNNVNYNVGQIWRISELVTVAQL